MVRSCRGESNDGKIGSVIVNVLYDGSKGVYGVYKLDSADLVMSDSGLSEGVIPEYILPLSIGEKTWTVNKGATIAGVI